MLSFMETLITLLYIVLCLLWAALAPLALLALLLREYRISVALVVCFAAGVVVLM